MPTDSTQGYGRPLVTDEINSDLVFTFVGEGTQLLLERNQAGGIIDFDDPSTGHETLDLYSDISEPKIEWFGNSSYASTNILTIHLNGVNPKAQLPAPGINRGRLLKATLVY